MIKLIKTIAVFCLFVLMTSCGGEIKNASVDAVVVVDQAAVIHNNAHQLTEIIIYDVFTPPVASRIYAYTSLAAYEAVRYAKPGYESITAKLNGFPQMPTPDKSKKYNYTLAATRAFWTVALNVKIFSDTVLHRYEDSVEAVFKSALDPEVYECIDGFWRADWQSRCYHVLRRICIKKPGACLNTWV
jgi:hypothetical protein